MQERELLQAAKTIVSRKPRADAERNRLRLLDVAKAAFAEHGTGASLDDIARVAGVGPGTLYRHFPTRDALIEAVYRNETAQLVAAGELLSSTRPPAAALREWLLLFVGYIATKHDMYAVLNSMLGGTSELYSTTTQQVKGAITELVDQAIEAGELRSNLDPMAILLALAGVANVSSGRNGEAAATQLVDVLIAGMRAAPGQ